jgi:DNA-binding beta-propeller fold protein YncE
MPGGRAALVVATGVYDDSALTQLGATARDAEQMTAVLSNPCIGGFDVTQVINRGERAIKLQVEKFLARRRLDDVTVVYLSCHGILDAEGYLYFAAADTLKSNLASTAVEARWLLKRMEQCRARSQVLILDCCFSGAFARGVKGPGDGLRLEQRFTGHGRGRVVLTASSEIEQSFEGDLVDGVTGPSIFTHALAEGLRTWAADTDKDGRISADEAYFYAYQKVRDTRARQTPQIYIHAGEGKIWLALNPATPDSADGRNRIRKARTLRACVGAAAILVTVLVTLLCIPGANAVHVYSGGRYAFDGPVAIAVDSGHLWVANEYGNSVTELDANGGTWIRTVPGRGGTGSDQYGFSSPDAIAVGGARVWGANDDSVTELNASDGRPVRVLHGAAYGFDRPDAIAVDGPDLWVANAGNDTVSELNADNASPAKILSGGSYGFSGPDAIALDGAHLWVVNYNGTATELNANDGSWIRTVACDWLGFNGPDAIVADGAYLWVANPQSATVTELNADDGSQVRTLPIASSYHDVPLAIASDGTDLWVSDGDGTSLMELNAGNGRQVRTLSGDRYHFDVPYAIVADGTRIWVANERGNSVTELPTG